MAKKKRTEDTDALDPFSSLSSHVLQEIAELLSNVDLCRLAQTCRAARSLVKATWGRGRMVELDLCALGVRAFKAAVQADESSERCVLEMTGGQPCMPSCGLRAAAIFDGRGFCCVYEIKEKSRFMPYWGEAKAFGDALAINCIARFGSRTAALLRDGWEPPAHPEEARRVRIVAPAHWPLHAVLHCAARLRPEAEDVEIELVPIGFGRELSFGYVNASGALSECRDCGCSVEVFPELAPPPLCRCSGCRTASRLESVALDRHARTTFVAAKSITKPTELDESALYWTHNRFASLTVVVRGVDSLPMALSATASCAELRIRFHPRCNRIYRGAVAAATSASFRRLVLYDAPEWAHVLFPSLWIDDGVILASRIGPESVVLVGCDCGVVLRAWTRNTRKLCVVPPSNAALVAARSVQQQQQHADAEVAIAREFADAVRKMGGISDTTAFFVVPNTPAARTEAGAVLSLIPGASPCLVGEAIEFMRLSGSDADAVRCAAIAYRVQTAKEIAAH
jgi:hypothetical protein